MNGMTTLDPAEVMAEHYEVSDRCAVCYPAPVGWPCLPYRLAAEVATLRFKVTTYEHASTWEVYERANRTEAENATLRAKVERVRELGLAADKASADSLSRMHGGTPFPAFVMTSDLLAALQTPAPASEAEGQGEPEPPKEREVVDLVAALRASVEAARKRREAAMCGSRASDDPVLSATHRTETWIPCMKPAGHDGDHWSTSGCAGGQITWGPGVVR